MNVEQGWIERFEAFARSKPADEEYEGGNVNRCALAQFGFPGVAPSNRVRKGVPEAAYEAACYQSPSTFGALADRLAAIVDPNKGDLEKGV